VSSLADLLFESDVPSWEPLVHWRGRTWSRGEIADAADRLADTLRRMGVAPDSAVGALVPSNPLGVVTLFAVWRAGAVAAPLEPGLDLAQLVGDLRPAAVVRPSLDEESLVPQVVVGSGSPRHLDPGVAIVATTEGLPGPTRRVLLGHREIRARVDAASGTLRGTPGAHVVAVPLASWWGIDATLVATRSGDAVALLDAFSPEALAAAVRHARAETVMLTPAMVRALLDDPSVVTLEPLRFVRGVTAPTAADDARQLWIRFGVTVLGAYGRPELGGEVVGWTAGDVALHGDGKLGAAGRPYEGVEVRIVGVDRRDARPEESGEIWIRSPFAMRGTVSDRFDLDLRVDGDGFVHTGDVGRLDRDGFLWVDAPPAPAATAQGAPTP
jgi:acyl-CoA synthetase (AMP-forming)/AMP-acid ligase II